MITADQLVTEQKSKAKVAELIRKLNTIGRFVYKHRKTIVEELGPETPDHVAQRLVGMRVPVC